jgi:RNA polymerase sigma factor (sigma-70 family)
MQLYIFLAFIYFSSFFSFHITAIRQEKSGVFQRNFLSSYQLSLIDSILRNPVTDEITRNKIHAIMFYSYEPFAFSKTCAFRKLHRYKCQHIPIPELYTYASLGLYQSIQKYHPDRSFIPFASIYIQGALLKGMTDLHPISNIPKIERRKGHDPDQKKRRSKTQFVGENEWIWDKLTSCKNEVERKGLEQEKYRQIWENIDDVCTPFQKQVLRWKYSFFLEKIRNHREISEIMCCSEEWVRLQWKAGVKRLKYITD